MEQEAFKPRRTNKISVEMADGEGSMKHLKQRKARHERRKAKRDPECLPGYNGYRGYLT